MIDKKQEPDWLRRVRETHKFHIEHIKKHPKWTIANTAISLERSIGSVAQELKVYDWLRTHESELLKCEYFHEAIEFVRKRKHQLLIDSE